MNDKSDKKVAGIIVRSQNNPSFTDIGRLVDDGFLSNLQPRRSFYGSGEEVDATGKKKELPGVFYLQQPAQGGGRPRSFWIMNYIDGHWELEADFGAPGSHNQAIALLQALILIGVENVTAYGPLTRGYWHCEQISPADLIKKLESESAVIAAPAT